MRCCRWRCRSISRSRASATLPAWWGPPTNSSSNRPHRQRGAALIVALVVVSLVVVLAASLSSDALLMFRRAENQIHSAQAYAYLLGAEGVARAALLRDNKLSPQDDNLFQEWAPPQRFPTEYGWIAGQL